jgi:hypothetical protein
VNRTDAGNAERVRSEERPRAKQWKKPALRQWDTPSLQALAFEETAGHVGAASDGVGGSS